MISVYEKGADNSDENNYEDGDLQRNVKAYIMWIF